MADQAEKGIYGKIEEKYYDVLDWLDVRGIPVYKAVDWLEEKNIPSMPVAILGVLLFLALFVYLALGFFVPASANLTVLVTDEAKNPVSGAGLKLVFEGQELSKTTSASGTAAFENIPLGKQVSVEASKDGFLPNSGSTMVEQKDSTFNVEMKAQVTTLSRTFQLLKPNSSELVTEPVEIEFTCTGASFSQVKTTSSGIIDIEVPSNCGRVNVFPRNGFSTPTSSFDARDEDALELFLEKKEFETGSVLASVKDSSGKTLEGISVNLLNYNSQTASGVLFKTIETTLNGTAVFTDVPEGKYFVTTFDPSSVFSEYDSSKSGVIKEIIVGSSISFPVVLEKKVIGSIKLFVKEKDSLSPIENATVRVYKDASLVAQPKTDHEGFVEVSVGEQIPYNVSIDKENYLIENMTIEPSAQPVEVLLSRATAENSQSLTVSVVDEKGGAVENARLSLVDAATEETVGTEKTTGINGKAVFERVKEGAYYVIVIKPGFDEKTSETLQFSNRQQNELEVTLAIGFGNLEVRVFDEKKAPLAGAKVTAVNSFTGEALDTATSGSDGIAQISVRADKMVFAVVTGQGFFSFTTTPVSIAKDGTSLLQADLRKDISSLLLELAGVFAGDGTLREDAIPSLSPGQSFKARFLLLIPKGSAFQEAGVHIRTGLANNNSSNPLEKDPLYLSDFKAPAIHAIRGTTFTLPKGFSEDSLHFSTSNAKWVEAYFPNPVEGIYEIEADIVVSQNARPGTVLDLWYRAWGKSGSGYFRFPQDDALGSSESTAAKQGFYAQPKNKKFSVGPSSLCFGDFCASIIVENTLDGISTSVFDEFLAETSNNYRLKYSMSNISKQIFSAAELTVSDDSGAVLFGSADTTDSRGNNSTKTVEASSFSVPVGTLGENDSFSGSVDFEVQKEGTAEVFFRIASGEESKEIVFEKPVRIIVAPTSEMLVEILPKTIVPFVRNNVLVRAVNAVDETPIAGASVTVKAGPDTIQTGLTDGMGIFAFTMPAQNAGQLITFTVKKRGFKQVEKIIEITENILLAVPQEIREHLVVGQTAQKEIGMQFINATQLPLTISEVFASSEFDKLIDVDFDEELIGMVVDQNVDANTTIKFSLTREGASVEKPTTVKGTINIVVTNPNVDKKWNTRVPVEIRIGFGDEVDESDCLEFNPDNWEIFTFNEKRTLQLNVKNNCKVGGQNISLSNFQAKVKLGANSSPGQFSASSEVFDDPEKPVTLTNSFKVLASTLEEQSDSTVTIDFTPSSSSQELDLDFKALHFTQKGAEEITGKIKVTLHINDLSTCIMVTPATAINLTTCPFNTGYDNFPQYFGGQYPYSGYPQQYGQGYNQYGFGGGQGFPETPYYNNYSQDYGLQQNFAGQGFSGQTGTTPPFTPQTPDPNYRAFDPYQQQYGYGSGLPSYIVPEGNTQPNMTQQDYYQPFNRTYPFNNYFTPSYGGDVFSQGARFNFRCGRSQIVLTNNCSEAVDVLFSPSEGINVSKQQAKIEKGKQERIFVEPSYFFGVYPLEVFGKLSRSTEAPLLVSKIIVNVENQATLSYRDCISINPARKLSFNNFFGKPVTMQVTNSCYNQGVRLLANNDAIFFPANVLRSPTDIPGSGRHEMIENWAFLDETFETSPDGRSTQVLKYEIFKALKNYCNQAPAFPRPDLQSPFQVIGNLRYFFSSGYYSVKSRTNMVVNFFTPFGERKSINFPLEIEDWWEALPYAERIVSYGDPNLKPGQCVNTDVLNIENKYKGCLPESELDLLESQGFSTADTGKLMKIAYPIRQAQTCDQYFAAINTGSLQQQTPNQQQGGTGYPQGQQQQTGTGYPLQRQQGQSTGTGRPLEPGVGPGQLEQGGCGTVDTVSDVSPVTIEKNGIKVHLGSRDGREIEVSVDASGWRAAGRPETKIDERVFLTVTRLVPASSDRISIPIRFCVQGTKGGTQVGGEPIPGKDGKLEACQNGGETGQEVYTKYGFDRLKFDWRYDSIGKDACQETKTASLQAQTTPQNTQGATGQQPAQTQTPQTAPKSIFCDATQVGISLTKKADEIKKAIDTVTPDKDCGVEGGKCNELKNSVELFRFLTDPVKVKDDAVSPAKEYNFFALNGEIIENTKAKEAFLKQQPIEILKNSISATSTQNLKVIGDTQTLLSQLTSSTLTTSGSEVIIVLNNDTAKIGKNDYNGTRDALGIEPGPDASTLLMTLNEFKLFYNNLNEASKEQGQKTCEKDSVDDNCKISGTENVRINNGNGLTVTPAFLNDFINSISDVVFGIRNVKDVAPEKKEIVMKEIKSFGVNTYPSFADFYSANIEFEANLIRDAFTKDFAVDFEKEFSTKTQNEFAKKFGAWEFDTGKDDNSLDGTGVHEVKLKINWSKGKEIEKLQTRVELKQKSLLGESDNPAEQEYSKNPLLFMPLNGNVGLEGTTIQRQGYGLVFDRIQGIDVNTGVLKYSTYAGTEQFHPQSYKGSATALENMLLNFDNWIALDNQGEVLLVDLAGKTVDFFPSDPIGIEAKISKKQAPNFPIGLLYALNVGQEFISSDSLLNWFVEKDTVFGEGQRTVSDSLFSADELCQTGAAKYNGLVLSGGKNGDMTIKTIVYAPTRAFGVGDTVLSLICAKDTAQIRYNDFAADTVKVMRTGDNVLNEGAAKNRLADSYNLKALSERIKDKSICAELGSSTQKTLALRWNEAKILERYKSS